MFASFAKHFLTLKFPTLLFLLTTTTSFVMIVMFVSVHVLIVNYAIKVVE